MEARELPARLPQLLLPWYEKNKRDLPWRRDRDPYHIWVSEIMLQQTRVEAVKGYYARFLEALPTIEALANCEDDALHKLWEGLGYYSRVRNLKKAARVIVNNYGGVFPKDYESVRALPGIGPYTAGAVCSIAFDLPAPAVDGNVLRVAARLWDDPTPIDTPEMKNRVTKALEAIYPETAGAFTQALMELGATVCGLTGSRTAAAAPARSCAWGQPGERRQRFRVSCPNGKSGRRSERFLSSNVMAALRCGSGLKRACWPGFGNFPMFPASWSRSRRWNCWAPGGCGRRSWKKASGESIFSPILSGICGEFTQTSGRRPKNLSG